MGISQNRQPSGDKYEQCNKTRTESDPRTKEGRHKQRVVTRLGRVEHGFKTLSYFL